MVLEKMKGKVGDKLLEKVFDMIENIDLFDQLADMIKTVVPLKADITVKGKKAVEFRIHGFKNGELWMSVKRIREEPKQPTEEEKEGVEAEVEETEEP